MAEQAASQYGGFWIRVLASVVDSVILWVAAVIIIVVSTFLGTVGAIVAAVALTLLMFLYFPVMHASARQATFGKALLGLKVEHAASGGRISILRALGRDVIGKFISSFVLMIGFLMAAFTGRKQALHDMIASTVVAREGPSHVFAALAVAVVGYIAPPITVMFLGVGMLAVMMGGMGAAMLGGMMAEQQKEGMKTIPAPKPAPAAKPAPAPEPVKAAPAPAPVPVPAKVTPPPAPEKLAAAAPPVEVAPKPKPAPRKRPAAPKPPVGEAPAALPAPVPVPMAAPVQKTIAAPRYSDLVSAVMNRDAAGVSELLEFGKWADKPDRRGTTPLMVAATLGDTASAEALLKAGADGGRALTIARERGDTAMLTLLQRYGAR